MFEKVWLGLGPVYPPMDVLSQTEPELRTTSTEAGTQTEQWLRSFGSYNSQQPDNYNHKQSVEFYEIDTIGT